MLDDRNEHGPFQIIGHNSDDLSIETPFKPYDTRVSTPAVVTSIGLEMYKAIKSANILTSGEQILSPDYFAYVVLPLPSDAKQGTERESFPTISRTTTDSLGLQLAREVEEATEKQLKQWGEQRINWRWITLELPPNPTPELKNLFWQHHVDFTKGEALRFLAYGGKGTNRKTSTPKLETRTK